MDGNGAWRSKSRDRTNHPDKAKAAREGQPALYTIRIFIPHHTTASAIMKQVAVKAFSKADEAIAMLSFAYPGKVSMRFRRGPATSRSVMEPASLLGQPLRPVKHQRAQFDALAR